MNILGKLNKEDLRRIAENPNYLTGIYNYCDRWCERCPFTSRCLNYEIGENQINDSDLRDYNNNIFWEKLNDSLRLTIEIIEEEAEEQGIDLYNLDEEGDKRFYVVREKIVEGNSNLLQAERYICLVNEWFKESEEDLNLDSANSIDDALTITDAVEIIRWYQYQIFIKVKRALFSSIYDEDLTEDGQKSSDGSVKVALIGIDRSIGAWGKLYNYFNEKQDDILDILLHLSQMRNKLESEFPKARDFKRIGFDD